MPVVLLDVDMADVPAVDRVLPDVDNNSKQRDHERLFSEATAPARCTNGCVNDRTNKAAGCSHQFQNTSGMMATLKAYFKNYLKQHTKLTSLFAVEIIQPRMSMPTEPDPHPSGTDKMLYAEMKVK